jgi:hypothetical protein
MHLRLGLLALLLVLPAAADQVVLTRDGKRYIGRVTTSGSTVIVEGLAGRSEIPAEKVACIFTDPKQAVSRADGLVAQAKKVFEAARNLPGRDPERNPQLQSAIEILTQARDIYEALSRHYEGEPWAFLSKSLQAAMQFMRIIRDQKGSDIATSAAAEPPSIVPLASGDYAFSPPQPKERRFAVEGDLGPGQVALLKGLAAEAPNQRAEAIRRLASPPAPHALPDLLALLEKESHDEVLKVLGEALVIFDLSSITKSLGWAKKFPEPRKRIFLTALLKASGDKAAAEFLVDWIVETPPGDDRVRAAICSALRKFRDAAGKEIKDALTKSKDRRVQVELLKQLGVMGDKRNAPLLVAAIGNYRTTAVVGLIHLGKPALPRLIEGVGMGDADQKKFCQFAARVVTGTQGNSSVEFTNWYNQNRKQIDAEEEAFWAEQAEKDYPVDPRSFNEYERAPQGMPK